MAKIQDIGVGNYIRSPRGGHIEGSRGMSVQAWKVVENHGNSFLCVPVASYGPVTLDYSRHYFVPIDTAVDQVTV